jgi:Fe-S oxidoreductase
LKRTALHTEGIDTCTFCPSLCLHTCPVSTVEARDTVSPWGKVSLVHHVQAGHIGQTESSAEIAYKCTGCGACTSWCRHSVDVPGILHAARTDAVSEGTRPFEVERFRREDVSTRTKVFREALACQRYHDHPPVLLFPGHAVLKDAPDVLSELWVTLDRLEDDELTLGKASSYDSGYLLWSAGYEEEFLAQARRVQQLFEKARLVIVLSPLDLHMFTTIYPEYGIRLIPTFFDLASYVLPMLSGASVDRQSGTIGYFDSCHLARHCGIQDGPREVLKRITTEQPLDLALCRDAVDCCGAGGGFLQTSPERALEAAQRIIVQAQERGIERLLSFSPECVNLLQQVTTQELTIEHGITLMNEALRRAP